MKTSPKIITVFCTQQSTRTFFFHSNKLGNAEREKIDNAKRNKKTLRCIARLQEKENKDDKGDNNNIEEVDVEETSNSNSDKDNNKVANKKMVEDDDNKK